MRRQERCQAPALWSGPAADLWPRCYTTFHQRREKVSGTNGIKLIYNNILINRLYDHEHGRDGREKDRAGI